MPDLSTDDGLRAALRDVAAWGEPDAVPELDESAPIQLRAEPPRPGGRWVRPLVGAAAAVALVLFAVVVTRDPEDKPSETAVPAAPSATDLVGKDWRIDTVTADGERREIDPTYDAVLRFDAEGEFGGKTCNDFGGSVAITSTELAWGDEVVMTSMACLDENLNWLETNVAAVLNGTARWTLADGVLRIEGNDVIIELSERPAGFPTELVQLATSDPANEAQWQFGYEEATDAEVADGAYRYFLTWEGRSAPGTGYGNAGMAVDPELSLETMWLDDVDGGMFVFGTLPTGTATVRFEPVDGTSSHELTAYELPDGSLVYGQVVPVGKGEVVALDGDGTEIGRGRTVPAT